MDYFKVSDNGAAERLATACGMIKYIVYMGGEDVLIEDIISSRVLPTGDVKATIRWMKDASLIVCDNRVTRRSDGSSKSQKRQVHISLGELLMPLTTIPYPGDGEVAENIGNYFMHEHDPTLPDAYAVLKAFGMKDDAILTDGKMLTSKEKDAIEKEKRIKERFEKQNTLKRDSVRKVSEEEKTRRKDLIIGWLKENGPATVTEVAEGIGFSTPVIYNLMSREMYDNGELVRTVKDKKHLYDIPDRKPAETPAEAPKAEEAPAPKEEEKVPAKAVTDESMAFEDALVKMYTGKKVLISCASGNAYLVGEAGLKDLAHPDRPVQRFTAEEMAGRWEELNGLNKCPHCGADARVQSYPGKAEFWCACTNEDCGATTGHSEQISVAVKRWNRRG